MLHSTSQQFSIRQTLNRSQHADSQHIGSDRRIDRQPNMLHQTCQCLLCAATTTLYLLPKLVRCSYHFTSSFCHCPVFSCLSLLHLFSRLLPLLVSFACCFPLLRSLYHFNYFLVLLPLKLLPNPQSTLPVKFLFISYPLPPAPLFPPPSFHATCHDLA